MEFLIAIISLLELFSELSFIKLMLCQIGASVGYVVNADRPDLILYLISDYEYERDNS